MDGLGLPLALFLAAVVLALYAVEDDRPALFRFAKPAATLFLFGIAGVPPQGILGTLVLVGIAFSLAADIALLSDGQPAFITGLVLALGAHLAYAFAFGAGNGAPEGLAPFVPLAIFGIASVWLVRTLWPTVGSLRGPFVLYAAAITMMVTALFGTLAGPWPPPVSIAAAVGAVLFYFSDANLAWNRFALPYAHGQTVTLSLYWAGQLGIALAARWAGVLGG